MQKPKVLSSEYVLTTPWIKIRKDDLIWPNGKPGQYHVVELAGASCIICVQDERILTVEQHRYTMDCTSIELPMGGIKEFEPLEAARHELQEETGYTADQWKKIGSCYVLNGICRMQMHVFVAEGLHPGTQQLDDSETGMSVRWIPLDDWRRMIREGKISDAESLAAWTIYQSR